MLQNDADHGHSNWVSHARDLQLRYEIEQLHTRAIINTKVISHFQSQALESLKKHSTENKKFNLCVSFKTTYKFDPYLDYIQDFTVRSIIAKLRIMLIISKLKQEDLVKTKLQERDGSANIAKP